MDTRSPAAGAAPVSAGSASVVGVVDGVWTSPIQPGQPESADQQFARGTEQALDRGAVRERDGEETENQQGEAAESTDAVLEAQGGIERVDQAVNDRGHAVFIYENDDEYTWDVHCTRYFLLVY